MYCGTNSNSQFCAIYQICRPILDQYPESDITAAGKDCTLNIENVQLGIRRKRSASGVGYFYYYRILAAHNPPRFP